MDYFEVGYNEDHVTEKGDKFLSDLYIEGMGNRIIMLEMTHSLFGGGNPSPLPRFLLSLLLHLLTQVFVVVPLSFL